MLDIVFSHVFALLQFSRIVEDLGVFLTEVIEHYNVGLCGKSNVRWEALSVDLGDWFHLLNQLFDLGAPALIELLLEDSSFLHG